MKAQNRSFFIFYKMMKLKTYCFDLETTEFESSDRIVEIYIKIFPNGNENKTWLVN